MSWGGPEGEELRAQMRTELALTRQPTYRLGQAAAALKHVEKSTRLKALVERLNAAFDEIEQVLNR